MIVRMVLETRGLLSPRTTLLIVIPIIIMEPLTLPAPTIFQDLVLTPRFLPRAHATDQRLLSLIPPGLRRICILPQPISVPEGTAPTCREMRIWLSPTTSTAARGPAAGTSGQMSTVSVLLRCFIAQWVPPPLPWPAAPAMGWPIKSASVM